MTANGSGAVLVTGGAGFIGSHLVADLTGRGVEVAVWDDFSGCPAGGYLPDRKVKVDTVDLRQDDLRPLLAEHDFSTVFHLAGQTNVRGSVEDPRQDLDVNLGTTLNLLRALRDTGSRAVLVNVSSAAVYGEGRPEPFREDDRTDPTSPYAVSKLAAEHYVSVFARLFGLRAVSARLFPVYGPGQRKQVVFDLIKKLHDNSEEIHVHGDGSEVRDLNHVANVVEGLRLIALHGNHTGDVYNVAGGEPISIGRLVELLCRAVGVSPRIVYSGQVGLGVARWWTADTSRVEELGYKPRMRLADGLDDTVAWYRRQVAGG
ncbi:MAG: NAD-dependent epimerase/dehydratase family protein [Acidimicrobiales bacterium]